MDFGDTVFERFAARLESLEKKVEGLMDVEEPIDDSDNEELTELTDGEINDIIGTPIDGTEDEKPSKEARVHTIYNNLIERRNALKHSGAWVNYFNNYVARFEQHLETGNYTKVFAALNDFKKKLIKVENNTKVDSQIENVSKWISASSKISPAKANMIGAATAHSYLIDPRGFPRSKQNIDTTYKQYVANYKKLKTRVKKHSSKRKRVPSEPNESKKSKQ